MTHLRALVVPLAIALALFACGDGEPLPPAMETEYEAVWTAVGAGTYFNCGITEDQLPHCWGFYSAPPGSGGPFSIGAVPASVPESPPLRTVSAGAAIACGLDGEGRAFCWGRESFGELGIGGSERDSTRTPEPVYSGLRFAGLSVGYHHVCAVALSGEGYCWGENLSGALGTGELGPGTHRTTPTPVLGDLRFLSISAGNTQSCGVTTDHRGYCWGGGYGSVGVPHLDPDVCPRDSPCAEPVPQLVSDELRFAMVSAGNAFTCAVTLENQGYCWGGLTFGPLRAGVLGTGSVDGSPVPVAVTGGIRFSAIEAGTRAACGLDTNGVAYCWGDNSMGELGIGTADLAPHPAPEKVKGELVFRSLSLGEVSCGLTVEDALYCWGTSAAGLLGNGEIDPGFRAVPTRVHDPGDH
jgi:alpha-tubulin suppressor-like RCC1 family protein